MMLVVWKKVTSANYTANILVRIYGARLFC